MNIREQLFYQYADKGLQQLIGEMAKKYTPKKGRRFNTDGITYEIGLPAIEEKGINIEISSKIPEENFTGENDLTNYFKEVKKNVSKEKEKPSSIEMENIIRSSNTKEKKRDYVKLTYFCEYIKLYDEKQIEKEVKALNENKESLKQLPIVPGVLTLAGKLILLAIQEQIYKIISLNVKKLIDANKTVKKNFL